MYFYYGFFHLTGSRLRAACSTPEGANTLLEQTAFGLSATLYGVITFQNGRVQQNNFNDYPILRMNQMPTVEVFITPSEEPPGGVGEPGVPPIAPAVANAIFSTTGIRIRRLPIRTEELKKS